MSRLCTSLVVAGILMSTVSFGVHAGVVRTEHVEAELVAERNAVAPGEALTVALRMRMMPGWHTYWRNPGDSGFPTRLTWQLPKGFSASALKWPLPLRLPAGPLTNFGYEKEVFLLSTLTVPKRLSSHDVAVAARANWLVCSEDACIPESAKLSLQLPVGAGDRSKYARAIARTRTQLPVAAARLSRWQFAARRLAHGATVDVLPPAGTTLQSLTFFPYADSGIASGAPRLSSAAGVHRLIVESSPEQSGELVRLAGILVASNGFGDADGPRAVAIDLPLDAAATPTAAANASTETLTLSLALVFAFVGGLILNLMPCVLPVISIKVLCFVEHGAEDPQGTRKHGLLFALGVVLSFWALAGLLLALRGAGAELGWGFQLQSPVVIALLALFFFALGLNLSGVFEVGMMLPGGISGWRARNPYVDSLASGALAVAVASPCTAPFMGAALGYAVSQSGVSAFLVFTALGIGMAAPYLLLAWFPRWLRYLPRPGQWMVRFKQFLAFPIYGTVVWLAWVFGLQVGVNGLVMLLTATVMVGAAAWLLGMRPARPLIATAAALLALAAIVVAIPRGDAVSPVSARSADAGWEAFSPKRVAEHTAAGRPVFVDFTAAWCVTCQVNKQLVLHSDEVKRALEGKGVIRVIADWTRQDETITRTLAAFGRNGVPLYVLYRPHAEPLVLPAILTREAVLEALAKI